MSIEVLLLVLVLVIGLLIYRANLLGNPVNSLTCSHAYHKDDMRKSLANFRYRPRCIYCGELDEITEEDLKHNIKMEAFYKEHPEQDNRIEMAKLLIP